MSNLSSSYADALFSIALEENCLDEILSQTQQVTAILAETPVFMKFLAAPMISKKEKSEVTDKIFAGQINRTLLNYIKVMIQRKNTAELTASFSDFEKLYNRHNNIEKAVAVTAVPMNHELQARLVARLEQATGKKIILTNKVDPDCLGGVVLEFSDRQINDSIAQKLETLKNQLKNTNR